MPESYPCYVRISEGPDTEEVIELPTDNDGKIMLTTITTQYPDAIGLRFKSESGAWRGMRLVEGAFEPPIEGWGDNDYFITKGAVASIKGDKRKLVGDTEGPAASKSKQDLLADLIVLGLPYSVTEGELKSYFETFGELAHCQLKTDILTNRSKGFGFIRFRTEEAARSALVGPHSLKGRNLQVNFPIRNSEDEVPAKLFVGRLPRGTTTDQLRDHFEEYGPLKDVYIPKHFRGFGFVTFSTMTLANSAMSKTHQLNGAYLNVMLSQPKHVDGQPQQKMMFSDGMVVPGTTPQYMMPPGKNTRGGTSQSAQGGYYTAGYAGYQPQQSQQLGNDPYHKDNWKR